MRSEAPKPAQTKPETVLWLQFWTGHDLSMFGGLGKRGVFRSLGKEGVEQG